jgi:hypothetical protein
MGVGGGSTRFPILLIENVSTTGEIIPVFFLLLPDSELAASNPALIRAAARGLLENLELAPSNSRCNTPKKTFECRRIDAYG